MSDSHCHYFDDNLVNAAELQAAVRRTVEDTDAF